MRLLIAEKKDLAVVIAEALGNPVMKTGYIQCGSDIVTWCFGHLVKLAEAHEHNPAYEIWRVEDLPLKLRPHKYVPIPKTERQLMIIGDLLSKASEVVHAGDPDEEGQLLVEEVLLYFGNTCPVKRLLINDLNTNAARTALTKLRDNSEFYGLYQKGLARSIADQIYGFNMTRAYTLAAQAKGFMGTLSVGRVQTVILWLIVGRYLANRTHTAAFYYTHAADIVIGSRSLAGRYVIAEGAPVDDKGRLNDEAFAQEVARSSQNAAVVVRSVAVEEKTTPAPLPFSLLDLQVAVSKEHGIDIEKTDAIAQDLREKHKAITYNRSDCSYLSEEQFSAAPETLATLARLLPELGSVFADVDSERKSRAFNDKKTSAHTAIIPVGSKFDIAVLSSDERKVYLTIVRRYLAQFLPEKRYLAVEVLFDVAGNTFVATSTKVTLPGWSAVVAETVEDDAGSEASEVSAAEGSYEALAALKEGDSGVCRAVSVNQQKTKPLPLYTKLTLLKDMQRVSKFVVDPRIKQLLIDRDADKSDDEKGGIGTPATRTAHLTNLQDRKFYTVDKSRLVPTPLGIEFISVLPAIATRPDMTALWHEQQQRIEGGELTVAEFLDELEIFIAEQIQNVNIGNIRQQPVFQLSAKCPMCGNSDWASAQRLIGCRACTFKFSPVICEKTLTEGQIHTLLTKGKTGVLKGFVGQKGKFDAALRLNAEGQIKFVF
ncbi:type IA DNA topoisomerase [Pseudomonas chlororaphis]|uniref:type IA DNA topoisomerase n=1 Tax=Pseudomonas chlororaphis TaxID=587753 RepID=UPI002D79DD18|nr:DNA topoisomerase [Pseudomonas chlororaphis]